MLAADEEIDNVVLNELCGALEDAGDNATADDIRTFVRRRERGEDENEPSGYRPTFREVYAAIPAASPLASDPAVQAEFGQALVELGYAGIASDGGGVVLLKASTLHPEPTLVRGHRRGAVFVMPYAATRLRALPAPAKADTPDLFGGQDAAADRAVTVAAAKTGSGAGGAGGPNQSVSGTAGGERSDAARDFILLAERGAVPIAAATVWQAHAIKYRWPAEFCQRLAGAIERLPESVRRWAAAPFDVPWRPNLAITYRATLDEVPEYLRATFESAEAVTINHRRIEFWGNQFPNDNILRHEITHLAWPRLHGRSRIDISPATPLIKEATDGAADLGEAIINWAHGALPEESDPELVRIAADIRGNLRHYRKYQRTGHDMPNMLRSFLEMALAIPSGDANKAAAFLGTPIPGNNQFGEIVLFQGYAKRLGVQIGGDYGAEETVAYRCGSDPDYAERLFATIAPPAVPGRAP
jgi:hypothetical protein